MTGKTTALPHIYSGKVRELYAVEHDAFFFEDGAEPAQFDGYARIGHELLDDLAEPPAAVVVPVGNGALAIGVFRALADRTPDARRIAVSAAGAPAMYESWRAGRPVDSERSATFADGLAVRVAIPYAVDVLARTAQRMVRVDERELATAIGALASAGIRVEASGAAALAALAQVEDVAGPVVLIVTGRNIDDALYRRAVEDPGSFPSRNATT